MNCLAGEIYGRCRSLVSVLVIVGMITACGSLPAGRPTSPLIASPTACADFNVSVYFARRSTGLTREALDLLDLASTRARRCRILGVDVIGLADSPDVSVANGKLSQARVVAVTEALRARGFNDFAFKPIDPDAGGQSHTALADPFRRRAEIVFHLSSPS